MKRILIFTLFLSITGINWGLAQDSEYLISDRSLRFLMEENVNRNLSAILNERFPTNDFLIRTRIKLEPARMTEQPTKLAPVFTQKLAFKSASGINQYLADFWKKSPAKIDRITVYFLVDSSFSETAKLEMQNLIIESAQLDLTRGDVLVCEQLNLRRFTQPVLPITPKQSRLDFRQVKGYLPFFTGLLCSMFLGLILLKTKKGIRSNQSKYRKNFKNSGLSGHATDASTSFFGSSRSEIEWLVEVLPGVTGKLLHYWIELSPISGLQTSALLLRQLPVQKRENILQQLPAEKRQLVQKTIFHTERQNTTEVKRDFVSDFKELIRIPRNPVRCENLHQFINRQSDRQITALLQKMEDAFRAILLAHLPVRKAILYLKVMPDRVQKMILSTLGRLDKISPGVFENLAQLLSQQNKLMIWVNPALLDGLMIIKEILNAADSDFRANLIDYIQTYDPGLKLRLESYGMEPDFSWEQEINPAKPEPKMSDVRNTRIDKNQKRTREQATRTRQFDFKFSDKEFSALAEH